MFLTSEKDSPPPLTLDAGRLAQKKAGNLYQFF